jgi:recombination protein RecA
MSKSNDLANALDDILGANDTHLGVSSYLDTGLAELNKLLSGRHDGGLPMGRMVEIFGPASSGKTFISTMAMIAAQNMGGISLFGDHERSFEPKLAKSLGLNTDNANHFRYLRPKTFEEGVETAMKFCELVRARGLIAESKPLVYVLDSVAAAIPHEKLYDDKGNRREVGSHNMRDKLALASSCSQNYPMLSQFAEDNNMLVLLLNQTRMKPGVMYGDPTTTPGGAAAEFYASIRLSLGKKNLVSGTGKDKEVIGFEVKAKSVKNKVSRPLQEATWQVRFNGGDQGVYIDDVATNVDYMVRKGYIEKAGNRVEFDGKKLYQVQLVEQMKNDRSMYQEMMKLLPNTQGDLDKDVTETDIGAQREAAAESSIKSK